MREGGLLVRFRVEGDTCPLAEATRATGGAVEAQPGLLRSDGNVLLQFDAVSEVEALATRLDDDERLRYLHAAGSAHGIEFRCLSQDPCVQHDLFDIGFMPLSIRYRNGHEHYTGAVIGHDSLKQVIDRARESTGVKLEGVQRMDAASASLDRPLDVTPAQREAIVAALRLGYFGVPRDASAAEVAAELGVSQSAFLQRLHRAEQRIFAQLFGEG